MISSLIAQCALLSAVKMLYGCSDCCLFFSFPCNFNTKGQILVRKTKGMIFLWIIDLFPLLVRLSLLKYFSLGNTCISGISHWMFGFQARSNSFTWKSFMQLSHSIKPNSQKKVEYIHTIFEVNQTLSLVIKQNGTHVKENSNGTTLNV